MCKLELNQTRRAEITLGSKRYIMKCIRTRTDTVLVHFYGASTFAQAVLIATATHELKIPRHHIVLVREGIIERMEKQLATEEAVETPDDAIVDFSRMADLSAVIDTSKDKQTWINAKTELTTLIKSLESIIIHEPGHVLTHDELKALVSVALTGVKTSEFPLTGSIKDMK